MASDTMKNCLMYKLCYYRFWDVQSGYNQEPGYDTVRRAVIGVFFFSKKLETMQNSIKTINWNISLKPLHHKIGL